MPLWPPLPESFRPYILDLAARMGLKDWEFIIESEPHGDGTAASVTCVEGRKIAVIRLGISVLDGSPVDQRHYIVHELVHVHFAAMHNLLDLMLRGHAHTAYNQSYEYGVDAVAAAMAPLYPLPRIKWRKV